MFSYQELAEALFILVGAIDFLTAGGITRFVRKAAKGAR